MVPSGWAFATVQLRSVPLFEATARQVGAMATSDLWHQEQGIANLVKLQAPLLMDVLATKLEEVPFTVQGLANVAQAFAELQSEHAKLMRNLLQGAVARLSQTDVVDRQVSVKAMLSLSHALTTWDALTPEVMEQMEGILRRRASRLEGEGDAAADLKVMPLEASEVRPRILCAASDVGLAAIWKPPNWTVSLPDDEEFERPHEKSSPSVQPDTGHPLQSWAPPNPECCGDEVPGPEKIMASTIHQDPEVTLFENFVSEEEVEHLLQLCEGRWERSKVSKGAASDLHGRNTGAAEHPLGEEGYGDTRTSSSVHLQWDETIVTERIAARVAAVTQTKLAQVEPLVMLRYEPGQFFKLHHESWRMS
eukprot:s658_g41.t1